MAYAPEHRDHPGVAALSAAERLPSRLPQLIQHTAAPTDCLHRRRSQPLYRKRRHRLPGCQVGLFALRVGLLPAAGYRPSLAGHRHGQTPETAVGSAPVHAEPITRSTASTGRAQPAPQSIR